MVGCFSSGFDSWRLRCWFDVGTGSWVSPLWVFEVLERVLVGMLVADWWVISERWGWEGRMSNNVVRWQHFGFRTTREKSCDLFAYIQRKQTCTLYSYLAQWSCTLPLWFTGTGV